MIYTIGYGGLHDFHALLSVLPVHTLVVDVRHLPLCSWCADFSGSRLSASLGRRYMHMKALGNPAKAVDSWKPRSWDAVHQAVQQAVARVYACRYEGVVLLCAEKDYRQCHRRFVAPFFQEKLGGRIVHLRCQESSQLDLAL